MCAGWPLRVLLLTCKVSGREGGISSNGGQTRAAEDWSRRFALGTVVCVMRLEQQNCPVSVTRR